MNLTLRQQRALESICETFLPRAKGWPSALDLEIPKAIAEAMDYNPRSQDRAQLLQLLDFWDSRLHGLFTLGRLKLFSALSSEDRIRVLLSWADSNIAKRRAVFQALRKAVGFLYVMLPRPNGARSPVWDHLNYPGPLRAQKVSAPRPLSVIVPDRDMQLSSDVCVIGSGAGGGTAAAVLSRAGKDVIVVEAGAYYDDADFDGAELGGFQNLYTEAGFAATADHSVGLLAGECFGGTTVINYCTSFRTPDDIRTEWAAAGVPWFTSAEYTRSLDAV
ncbi:MAG TPA: GMC family oxidoreductase N-terminal domain-containing protein, partial [Candidatus Acidoferrum sp.]|nr:GMC family oxidoreductase N-terminal domain-containing protein [Candidatus Acidoferrum sp.]